ncbi:MAG: glutamate transport system permease protein [Acidimicrobiaceae bacterium]|jgi:glutamate transport system permease protein|nr:glutamate transport system permease protein [Acidimicrobiaceae bacterium]
MTMSAFIDAPGPRGRRRQRVATVVAVAVVALSVVIAFRRLRARGQLDGARWKIFTDRGVWEFYLRGFGQTLKAGAVGGLLALAIGMVLALGRLARSAPIRWLSILYVETFRAVPLVLLMFFSLLGLPKLGLDLGPFWSVVAGLTAYNAAVLAEILRAGILAMPHGQTEAAYSIGLRHWQAMRLVILPQAFRAMVPALASQLILLLKDTSLGALVGYEELLRRAQITGEFSRSPLQALTVAALFFALVIFGLNHLARRLERRRPSVALGRHLPMEAALAAGAPLGTPIT